MPPPHALWDSATAAQGEKAQISVKHSPCGGINQNGKIRAKIWGKTLGTKLQGIKRVASLQDSDRANPAAGRAHSQRPCRDVLCNDASSTYHAIFAYADTRSYNYAPSYPAVAPDAYRRGFQGKNLRAANAFPAPRRGDRVPRGIYLDIRGYYGVVPDFNPVAVQNGAVEIDEHIFPNKYV